MGEKKYFFKIIINIMMFIIFGISVAVLKSIDKSDMTVSVVFNISVGIISLLGLAILGLVDIIDENPDTISSGMFFSMVVIAYVGIICDNFTWALEGHPEYRVIIKILNLIGFLIIPGALDIYWNYQNHVFIGRSGISNVIRNIVNIGAFIDLVFIIIGSITGTLFYIDANGNYVSGIALNCAYIYPVLVVACCVFENIKRKIPLKQKLPILAFGMLPAVTIGALIVLPEYSFLYSLFFMDLILIYGTVQNRKSIEIAEQKMKIAEQDKELTEKHTQTMISQIQPHFLYNTLTAIYQLCDTDTALAKKTIENFSKYLRNNMDSVDLTHPVTFEKELNHVKTYLEIELLRFSDMLKVEYDIKTMDFMIPALTLQPIVENAVKYGVRSREDGGTVTISTKKIEGKVYISVSDDGMGFDINEKKNDGRKHIGIENTRNRLKMMVNGEMVIDSRIGVGTTVTIILDEDYLRG